MEMLKGDSSETGEIYEQGQKEERSEGQKFYGIDDDDGLIRALEKDQELRTRAEKPVIVKYKGRPEGADIIVRQLQSTDLSIALRKTRESSLTEDFVEVLRKKERFEEILKDQFGEAELEKTELWYILQNEEIPLDGMITQFDVEDGMIQNFMKDPVNADVNIYKVGRHLSEAEDKE